MNEAILIFAAKRVGTEITRFLLDTGAPVRKIVVGTADDGPIIELAKASGIDCSIYGDKTQADLCAAGTRYGWLLNLWCPHILRRPILDLADRHLNVHPGLVPQNRGNDCATWVIRKGMTAGVSLLEMDESVDGGAVYASRAVTVPFPCTARELMVRLSDQCIALFREQWPAIHDGRVQPVAQPAEGKAYRRRQTLQDRSRRASDTATLAEFVDWALAHDFAPDTTAICERDGKRYSVRVLVRRHDD